MACFLSGRRQSGLGSVAESLPSIAGAGFWRRSQQPSRTWQSRPSQIRGRPLQQRRGEAMGCRAAIPGKSAALALLLVSVVPVVAASDERVVPTAAGAFHALSRIEQGGVGLIPLSDDELAGATRVPRSVERSPADQSQPTTTPRSVAEQYEPGATGPTQPPSTAARQPGLAETSGGSPPGVSEGAGSERAGDSPSAKPREPSAVEEEPDPRAVIDWLFRDYKQRGR